MSLVNVEEALSLNECENFVQCCDKHFLVDSKIYVPNDNDDNITSYINIRDLAANLELQNTQKLLQEKVHHIVNLEQENLFLKNQVKVLNNLLDQLSTSTKSLATRNDIRINVSNLTYQKWYRRPRVVLTGSAIAALVSIYLRYKIKNW